MDKFIKHIFPARDAPGLEVLNNNGIFLLSSRAVAKVKLTDYPYHRNLTMKQTMTHLGKGEAVFQGGPSSLDGVNKLFLEVEGKLNFKALSSELKNICGVQAAMYSSHIANAEVASWHDNQTALLVNCLRYAVLAKLSEANGAEGIRGTLPVYDDGDVRVDRDQVWDTNYPESSGLPFTWPGGSVDENYPLYTHQTEILPSDFGDIISLRGMDTTSSRFILAMCGEWKRQSRYTLDFSTPLLTQRVNYRREAPVDMMSWLAPEDNAAAVVPPTVNSSQALNAIRRYVIANRLFSNYSDALGIISDMWMQYVPDTCEGNAWLATTRLAVLPKFTASRARYQFLVEGEGALLSPRAIDEYYYVGDKLERLGLASVLKSMAAYVGLYSRAVRRCNEDCPTDIITSESYISRPETQYAAAISEAVRVGVPRVGVTGGYVYLSGLADGRFGEPVVLEVSTVNNGVGHKVWSSKGRDYITISVLPPPGVPLLLLPLPMFGDSGPWALKGEVNFKGSKDRYGVQTTMEEAHQYAWIARLCGEDVGIKTVETVNASKFFASNEASFVYTLQMTDEDRLELVKVNKKTPRENQFIFLPNVHTRESDAKIPYELEFITHNAKRVDSDHGFAVTEYGGHATVSRTGDLVIDVSVGVKKLRGYIRREQTGFYEVEDIKAATIPPKDRTLTAALEVTETAETGGLL